MYFPGVILGNTDISWSLHFEKPWFSSCTQSSMTVLPWTAYVNDDKLYSFLHIRAASTCFFSVGLFQIILIQPQSRRHQDPIITVYWVNRKQAVQSLLGSSASIYEVHCKIRLIAISLAINVAIMILSTYFQINLTELSPRIRRHGLLHSLGTNIVVSTHQCPIALISLASHS